MAYWSLAVFVFLSNLYLYAFGLDALLSVIDDVRRLRSGGGEIWPLRESIAIGVFLFSLVMLFVLFFVHQLPKRVLLPPILFSIWVAFGAIPIWLTPDHVKTSLSLGLIQFALFGLSIILLRGMTGASRLDVASLPQKSHVLLRAFSGVILSLVLLPAVLLAGLSIGFAQMIEKQTGGYMHFTNESVEAREAVLVKGDKTVYLIGMIHIAEPVFYRTVFTGIPANAIVLAEGVTDRKGLMKDKLSYHNAASILGLEHQPDILSALDEKSKPVTGKEVAKETVAGQASPKQTGASERVVHADIDIADFTQATVTFLKDVGGIYASESFSQLLERLAGLEKSLKPEDMKLVTADIVDKRNAKVISVFKDEIAKRDALVIAWGAIHMPVIEKAVLDEGFTLKSQRSIPAIRYSSLWESLMRGLDGLLK